MAELQHSGLLAYTQPVSPQPGYSVARAWPARARRRTMRRIVTCPTGFMRGEPSRKMATVPMMVRACGWERGREVRRWAAALLALVAVSCAPRRAAMPPPEMSGFLDDYSLLREGGTNELRLVYRNPKADWHAYDK